MGYTRCENLPALFPLFVQLRRPDQVQSPLAESLKPMLRKCLKIEKNPPQTMHLDLETKAGHGIKSPESNVTAIKAFCGHSS